MKHKTLKKTAALSFIALNLLATSAKADQPIMSKMPRWDGGYGWQVINEYTYKRDLLKGRKSQGSGLYEEIYRTHLEGVYTWDKSIRMTIKVPYTVQAERVQLDSVGKKVKQRTSGLGDITLALPLKKYFNEDGYSGSWTFAPQLRLPTGEDRGDYTLPDRAWATGLSLGYERETFKWFVATGVTFWEAHSDDPFEFKAHLDLGRNFADRGQFLVETDYHYEDDGTSTLMAGPALYWRFSDTLHSRIEWKYALADRQGETDHGNGHTLKFGLGWVF